MPVAEGRAVPPVPPSQVGHSNHWTALPPQHCCCLFLLPTHPVYLKRPQDNIARGTCERETDPAPSPRGQAGLLPRTLPVLQCELLRNYKHLLTSTPISHRPRSSWRGAERCQPSREQCVHYQPPPRRGPRTSTRARPSTQLPSGVTRFALPSQLHRAGTSRGFQPL